MSHGPPEIAGRVLDATSNPIPGARVYIIQGPVPVPDIAALTDGGGRFRLDVPVPGVYQVGVAGEVSTGFGQVAISVEVVPDEARQLEVRLDL